MFDWDAGNVAEIARHGLTAVEVEHAMADRLQLPAPARSEPGELRSAIIGVTAAGRLIEVVYTMRGDRFRVVTAYPVRGRLARAYWETNR